MHRRRCRRLTMITTVRCCSASYLQSVAADRHAAVISICRAGGRAAKVPSGYSGVLYLSFDDVPHRRAAPGAASRSFTRQMAHETLYFLIQINRIPLVRTLLCQCEDGCSRAAPIAAYAAALYGATLVGCETPSARPSPTYERLMLIAPVRRFGAKLAACGPLSLR